MSAYLRLQMESESLGGGSIDEAPELHQLAAQQQGLPLVGLVLFFIHGVYAGAGAGAQGEREAVEDPVQAAQLPPHMSPSLSVGNRKSSRQADTLPKKPLPPREKIQVYTGADEQAAGLHTKALLQINGRGESGVVWGAI